jgi:NitT/TauT family transport system substrate-binding protein
MSLDGSYFARVRSSMAIVAGILGATVWSATAFGADKITFLTSWFAQAEHGGFYQAKATGLYEKAGLDVTLKMGGPQVNGVQLLLAGETDFMMGYDLQVLKMLEQGLPVLTVGTSFQFDLQGIMAHDNVAGLGDLKDKTILVATPGRTTWWPWLKAKFRYTDEQTRPYTFNLQPFFADKNVVQQSYPSSEPFQAKQQGVPVKFFLFAHGYDPRLRRQESGGDGALRQGIARRMEELFHRPCARKYVDQGRQSEDERRADRLRDRATASAQSVGRG